MMAKKSLSPNDLQEKLPYVPAEKISAVLSGTKKYLPTNEGKYFPVSKIRLDMEELDAAKLQMLSEIDANGFATIEDHSFSSCLALNPELNKKDLLNVIYRKFFSATLSNAARNFSKKVPSSKEMRPGLSRSSGILSPDMTNCPSKNFSPLPKISTRLPALLCTSLTKP